MANDKYKLFRNLFFNELGITKEDIRDWVKEACKEEAEQLVKGTYERFNPETYIKEAMQNNGFLCNGKLSSQICQQVAELVVKKLDIRVKQD